jgi:hypothetical protein
VAVGHFTGSGVLDLAVADTSCSGRHQVSVLLGNGDGTFQAARNYAAGLGPYSVAVGDFDGDGTLDLTAAGAGGLWVLLGNGDGTFRSTNFSYVADFPRSVAVGDFNGDGAPDLAVADGGSSDVSILLNDGIWNGPAPRPGGAPRLNFAALPSALPAQQAPEARLSDPLAAVSWAGNPLPHQPLLDWLGSAPIRLESAALPPAVFWSREGWDAFSVAGVFDLGNWDIAALRSPLWTS